MQFFNPGECDNEAYATVDADSDLARGIRIGVDLSLELLGELPFKVERSDTESEDDDG